MKITLIEKEIVERAYGFYGIIAIVDCEKNGRLLIMDGFGGMDTLDGGAMRFRHGTIIQLKSGDTIKGLNEAKWNDYMGMFDAVMQGCDNTRPVLDWGGLVIDKIAKSVGL